MEENGLVTAVHGDRAEVEIVPGDACKGCSAAGFCNWTGKRQKLLTARNRAGAGVGDPVVVRTVESGRSRSAALVFGVPAVSMLAGVLLGSLFWSDPGAAFCGGVGLAVGLLALKLIDIRAARSGRNLPVVTRRLGAPTAGACADPASDAD